MSKELIYGCGWTKRQPHPKVGEFIIITFVCGSGHYSPAWQGDVGRVLGVEEDVYAVDWRTMTVPEDSNRTKWMLEPVTSIELLYGPKRTEVHTWLRKATKPEALKALSSRL